MRSVDRRRGSSVSFAPWRVALELVAARRGDRRPRRPRSRPRSPATAPRCCRLRRRRGGGRPGRRTSGASSSGRPAPGTGWCSGVSALTTGTSAASASSSTSSWDPARITIALRYRDSTRAVSPIDSPRATAAAHPRAGPAECRQAPRRRPRMRSASASRASGRTGRRFFPSATRCPPPLPAVLQLLRSRRAATPARTPPSSSPVRKCLGKPRILSRCASPPSPGTSSTAGTVPPDPALHTLRSKLLRITERNDTHVQVNRDLLPEFAARPRSPPSGTSPSSRSARRAGPLPSPGRPAATPTSSSPPATPSPPPRPPRPLQSRPDRRQRGWLQPHPPPPRHPLGRIIERRELVLHEAPPRAPRMAFARTSSGLCIANLHATVRNPPRATDEVLHAAARRHRLGRRRPRCSSAATSTSPPAEPPTSSSSSPNDTPSPRRPATRRSTISSPAAPNRSTRRPPGRPQLREVAEDGRAMRLSDHSPIHATFEAP